MITESKSISKKGGKYIKRGQKEINEFCEAFKSSLGLGHDDDRTQPIVYVLHGLSGVGKHTFLYQLEKDVNQACQRKLDLQHGFFSKPLFLRFPFDQIGIPRSPLKLMKVIADRLAKEDLIEKSGFHLGSTPFLDRHHTQPFEHQTFHEVYSTYEETLWKLKTKGLGGGNEGITKEQTEYVVSLIELGSKAIAPPIVSALGISDVISEVATQAMEKTIPQLANELLRIRDELLNKHTAIKNENTRNLLMTPLVYLTPRFVDLLIEASWKRPIVVAFEKLDKTYSAMQMESVLNDWISQCLLSANSRIFSDSNKAQPMHSVRLIISTRDRFDRPNSIWNNLIRWKTDFFKVACLEPYSREKTFVFLEEQINQPLKDLTEADKHRYYQFSKGHSRYLELICEQKNKSRVPDESKLDQKISELFLENFSEDQKQIIQIIACCRWFDRQLAEPIQKILEDHDLLLSLPQQDIQGVTHNVNVFDWLAKQHFVKFGKERYSFHDLVRQVFRRRLFQENRELFYQVHGCLADYFRKRADKLRKEKPQFTKYSDLEWCEYIGEYLYHACFAQQADYQESFLYHLFASIYRRQGAIIKIAFDKITAEFDIENHPLLQSPTREFLQRLEFVVKYRWVAFELSRDTNYGKYQSKIEAAVQLIQNHIEKLPEGIGTVAALEYVVKNFPLNMSDEDREKWKQALREAIVTTADKSDPDFSSRLFMQSVCWQAGHDMNALEWCVKALEYKSDNANAWFKKGQILKAQGDELNQSFSSKEAEAKYNEAEKSYEKAIQIQSFDHRYWQASGQVLECLGELYNPDSYRLGCEGNESRCPLRKHAAESDKPLEDGCGMDDEKCRRDPIRDQLRSASYFRHAHVYYQQAQSFRPDDSDLATNANAAKQRYQKLLEQVYAAQVPKKGTLTQAAVQPQDLNYGELIKQGDEIRCTKLSEDNGPEKNLSLLAKAFDFYTTAIWKQPEYPLAWYSRGLAFAERAKYMSGSWSEQEEEYRHALRDYEKALSLKNDLTWAYYDSGNAFSEIARLQKQHQQSDEIGFAEASREFEQAIESYDQAIRINSDYEEAWYGRGLTLFELRRYDEAIASFDKAIECEKLRQEQSRQTEPSNGADGGPVQQTAVSIPQRAWYWYDRGNAFREHHDIEEAIASYKKAIEIAAETGRPYFDPQLQLGLMLRQTGDYGKSAEELGSATDILSSEIDTLRQRFPESPRLYRETKKLIDAYRDKGDSLRRGTHYSKAIECFKRAQTLVHLLLDEAPSRRQELSPKLAALYCELGDTHKLQTADSIHSEALRCYRAALDCDRNCRWAFDALKAVLTAHSPLKAQYYQEIISTFEQLAQQLDQQPETDREYRLEVKIALLDCYVGDKTERNFEKAIKINTELKDKYANQLIENKHYKRIQRHLDVWEKRKQSGKGLLTRLRS